MNPLRWLEEKLFFGRIVHDYGVIDERRRGIGRTRVSLLLCWKEEDLVLVIKESNVAFFAFSTNYTYIHERQLPAFKEAVDDAYDRVHGAKDLFAP